MPTTVKSFYRLSITLLRHPYPVEVIAGRRFLKRLFIMDVTTSEFLGGGLFYLY